VNQTRVSGIIVNRNLNQDDMLIDGYGYRIIRNPEHHKSITKIAS